MSDILAKVFIVYNRNHVHHLVLSIWSSGVSPRRLDIQFFSIGTSDPRPPGSIRSRCDEDEDGIVDMFISPVGRSVGICEPLFIGRTYNIFQAQTESDNLCSVLSVVQCDPGPRFVGAILNCLEVGSSSWDPDLGE